MEFWMWIFNWDECFAYILLGWNEKVFNYQAFEKCILIIICKSFKFVSFPSWASMYFKCLVIIIYHVKMSNRNKFLFKIFRLLTC